MSFVRETLSPTTWPAIYALLDPAIRRGGDTDARELIDELLADRAQLWVKRDNGAPVAAAVTTIHDDGELNCQLLGGKGLSDWVDSLIATVAALVPGNITKFVETGRKGWVRFLEPRGWKHVETLPDGRAVMELTLE
jgi:hypothetical protein